jgi:hypothetical protein
LDRCEEEKRGGGGGGGRSCGCGRWRILAKNMSIDHEEY